MAYSVVGGPALGFDLARLPGGPQVAAVLRLALAVGPDDLERLARSHPGAAQREQWRHPVEVGGREHETASDVLPLAGAAVDAAAAGETALLHRLETGMLGDAHALDRLVRRDLLDWTWQDDGRVAVQQPVASLAADVLVDAATSAYLRERLAPGVRRAMAAPLVGSGLAATHGILDLAVGVPDVDARLTLLAAADEPLRAAWRAAVEAQRTRTAEWAPAMHQATWAISLSERLRLSLDAQLAAVQAFSRGGFTARDAAYGVWNAWSGTVQASVVADLLPSADADVLLRPWRKVHGDSD